MSPLVAGLVVGLAIFVVAYNDIYAAEAVFQSALHAELQDVVFLFDVTLAEAVDALRAEGIEIESQAQTIHDIASMNGLEVYDVIDPLFILTKQ